jgi:hypothetical protein
MQKQTENNRVVRDDKVVAEKILIRKLDKVETTMCLSGRNARNFSRSLPF